ncbi:MAG: hypothetical protein M3Q03_16870 [Chloroflexota bacterium]|nr:hypothetical protein [Chloroflexota bacterium]
MPQPPDKLAKKLKGRRRRGSALRATTATMTRAEGEHRCDFCERPSASADLTDLPCQDFTRRAVVWGGTTIFAEVCSCHAPLTNLPPSEDLVVQNVVGAWAACPECRRLVERDDREGLARLAARHASSEVASMSPSLSASGEPNVDASLVDHYAEVHLGFWLHREGAST